MREAIASTEISPWIRLHEYCNHERSCSTSTYIFTLNTITGLFRYRINLLSKSWMANRQNCVAYHKIKHMFSNPKTKYLSGCDYANILGWNYVSYLTSMLLTPGEWPNHHRPLGFSSKFTIILFWKKKIWEGGRLAAGIKTLWKGNFFNHKIKKLPPKLCTEEHKYVDHIMTIWA